MGAKLAPVSEVGGVLVVPNWLTPRGNPIGIQHGQDGEGRSVFQFVEVWKDYGCAVSSLNSGVGKARYASLGEARAAADKLLGNK